MRSYGIRSILVLLAAMGLALAPLAGSPVTSLSAAEQLDPTFRWRRQAAVPVGPRSISGQAVIVQPATRRSSSPAVRLWMATGISPCCAIARMGRWTMASTAAGPGFGTGGRVITDFGGDFHDSAMDAALQPDGKIVVAGTSSRYPQFDMAVARYNPDGSLDTTFDGDGMVKVDFQNSDERGYAVAVQPDGKIIVAGVSYITTWGDFALARLCPNGALDDGANCGSPAFGAGGKVRTDFSGSSDWVVWRGCARGQDHRRRQRRQQGFRRGALQRQRQPGHELQLRWQTDSQLRNGLGLWAGRGRANGRQDHPRRRRLRRRLEHRLRPGALQRQRHPRHLVQR